MRVEVFGEDTISSQARAYAEYRVFSALTQVAGTEKVTRATVALRVVHVRRGHGRVVCTVTIESRGSASLCVRATGEHVCEAINRAVERIATPPQRPSELATTAELRQRAFRDT